MISWQEEKDRRNTQALARLTKSLPSTFPPGVLARALSRPFLPPTPRLAIDSYWRAHPLRADRLARALATRSGVGRGSLVAIARPAYRSPFEPRRRPIESAPIHAAPDSAVCAASPFTVLAGMLICGTRGRTRTRTGIAPASSRGISGMRRMGKPLFSGACKHAVVLKAANGCGGTLRLTIELRYFEYGASNATPRGRSCSTSGACLTCRSSIATRTP